MNKGLLKYFDLVFVLKFIAFFLAFYFFNLFFIGVTAPGGTVYSAFLDNYLNYVAWIRSSILHTANFIADDLGSGSYVLDQYTLKAGDASIHMVYTCIGLGIMSFWVAFVLAHKSSWKKKVLWSLGGVFAIWMINCWRIALLLMALDNNWEVERYVDQHTLFNITGYSLILLMIYLYSKKTEENFTELAI